MDKYSRYIDAEELKHILNSSKYYGTKAGRDFADMIAECNTVSVRDCASCVFEQQVKSQFWFDGDDAN